MSNEAAAPSLSSGDSGNGGSGGGTSPVFNNCSHPFERHGRRWRHDRDNGFGIHRSDRGRLRVQRLVRVHRQLGHEHHSRGSRRGGCGQCPSGDASGHVQRKHRISVHLHTDGTTPHHGAGSNTSRSAGTPTLFTGFNAYQLATDWGTNAGCGGMATPAQIDCLLFVIPPRFPCPVLGFQGTMATNVHTGQLDWAPLDNVFYTAARYHVYLIPVISDQGGTCDGGHWQNPDWYSGGFKDVYNSADNSDGLGLTPLSYWDYMNALVSRYADSPALGMWEPMSEAEASTCPAVDEPSNCSGNQTCPNETAAANALTVLLHDSRSANPLPRPSAPRRKRLPRRRAMRHGGQRLRERGGVPGHQCPERPRLLRVSGDGWGPVERAGGTLCRGQGPRQANHHR